MTHPFITPIVRVALILSLAISAIPAAGQGCLELVSSIPGGPARTIAADDNVVVVGLKHWLQTIDVTDPDAPTILASLRLPRQVDGISHIELAGSLAYIIASHDNHGIWSGLHVVDVSDPTAPVHIGELSIQGSGGRLTIQGELALLANSKGLHTIDVSNPNEPTKVGFVEWDDNLYTSGVDVVASGTYAYVTTSAVFPTGPGIDVVDLTDPTAPALVGRFETPYYGGEIERLGSHLVLTAGDAGLRVVDVTSPVSPVEAGFLDTPGSASGLDLTGDLAAVADAAGGLRIIDLGDPLVPVEIGSFSSGDNVYDVSIGAGKAYLRSSKGNPHVIDILNPTDPAEQGSLPSQPAGYRGLAVSGGVAAATTTDTSGSWGLRLFDVHDPADPSPVGFFELTNPYGVEIIGSHAFVLSSDDGLHVIDISTPSAPTEVAHLQPPGAWYGGQLEAAGSLLAFLAGFGNIVLVDVSDPLQPFVAGEIDLDPFAGWFSFDGDLLTVIIDHAIVQIYDVSTPNDPIIAGEYSRPMGWDVFETIDMSDSVAYIRALNQINGGLLVELVDLAVPGSPVRIGFTGTNSPWFDAENGFTIESGGYRLHLLETGSLGYPTEVSTFYGAGDTRRAVRSGKYIYVGSDGSALDVLTNCSLFADSFDLGRMTAWAEVVD